MAKISRKPTPAQGRILRELSERPALFVLWNGRMADFTGHNAWQVRNELGRPRASTVRKMITQGWLAPENEGAWGHLITEQGRAALEDLDESDFVSTSGSPWSAEMVISALRTWFKPDEWLWVEELHVKEWKARRIDAFALRLTAGRDQDLSKYLTRWAIEVKVSHLDFLNELQDPTKRRPAMGISNVFAFAAPAGIIGKDEIPDDCGLLEVHSAKRVVMRVRPPWRRSDPPTWELLAAIGRQVRK